MPEDIQATLDRPAITSDQARAVLDALPDGIAVLGVVENDHMSQTGFAVELANKRFARLLREDACSLYGQSFTSVFAPDRFGILHDAVSTVYATRQTQRIELDYAAGSRLVKLAIRVAVDKADALRDRILVTFRERVNDRPVVARVEPDPAGIGNVSVLEASRRDLEEEVVRLRMRTRQLELTSVFDQVSGLLNRKNFLDRASAEFQRALRYANPLSLIIITLEEGVNDVAVAAAAQCCESNCRSGVDILGRTGSHEIALLLPETDLNNTVQCAARLKNLFEKTPMPIEGKLQNIGVRMGIDGMLQDDYSFLQIMQRALQK